ncbi:MAG: bifunctional isocitrate dehydrogenase kinase/phosphatase [Actinomycetota bacterium]|nr:bifunctional isocitrate dehydrogenase kinase/phosphatase [Actinomycetota bacterium]
MTSVAVAADAVVAATVEHYVGYVEALDAVNRSAADAFSRRDWAAAHRTVTDRLDAYADAVGGAVAAIEGLGDHAHDHRVWAEAKVRFAAAVAARADVEIAETFFNSCTRRLLITVGVDPAVEFLDGDASPVAEPAVTRLGGTDLEELVHAVVTGAGLGDRWQNLTRDVLLACGEIRRARRLHGVTEDIDGVIMVTAPFYRGQGAYLVGRLSAGSATFPLAIAVHHTTRGLVIGAVLTEAEDVGVLFSYTRAAFCVATACPSALVTFLGAVMPSRSPSQLYTAIGYPKHGKSELFRDFSRHIAATTERFEYARGIRGMVMIVFTVPGYDVVFKVIRDRFPYPKQTTRRRVMAQYRLVARHDRAGRLVDAHEFENLRFPRERFQPGLLAELAQQAARSVSIEDDQVILQHAYVERRLAPLDLYLREANPVRARSAIIDYGRAIKNLAAANVFPGDLLLKNFGVTRGGRVVFYDYDEITPLTECNFRQLPESDRPDEEMAADPWFGVGDHDIFPEEFSRFLGLRGELWEALSYHHGDLFEVRFWERMQQRLRSGEAIEIFPYSPSRRLGARMRRVGDVLD